MAALSAARNTPRMLSSIDEIQEYPMAASTTIYQGSLVMLDAGVAKPGATATGKFAAGRAMETKTSAASGTTYIKVETGVFKFANEAGDAVDANDVGAVAWIVDDQTVAETNGTSTRSPAGIIRQLDSDGVWVQVLNGQRLA
jgi:predicted deacylase